jgi:hypothetical protein
MTNSSKDFCDLSPHILQVIFLSISVSFRNGISSISKICSDFSKASQNNGEMNFSNPKCH